MTYYRRSVLYIVLVSLVAVTSAEAQTQTILAATRSIDWSGAGVTGGIPTRTTNCATLSPGASASQINSAIANCPDGQVVFLNAGTYNLSSGIDFAGNSNVTLRGAGPAQTTLNFTNGVPCGGMGGDVCFENTQLNNTDAPGNTANWTAGFAKGSTQITLSNTTNLKVGTVLILDQLNDSNSDTGGVWICSASAVCSDAGASGASRSNREQQQLVQVTGISGTAVTISPGLHMPNWRTSQSPQAWWSSALPITMSGIENLTVNHSGSSTTSGIYFFNAYKCWVKNVKSLYANRNHVWFYQSAHILIRDSYFYGTKNAASQSYGVESFMTSDNLVENNIFQRVTSPLIANGADSGTVWGYNYTTDMYYAVSPNWLIASNGFHATGIAMMLNEGNVGTSFQADIVHGTQHFLTAFRNVFVGWEAGKTAQTTPIHLYAGHRYMNIVGNVLGRPGYHTRYETAAPTSGDADTSVFALGWAGNEGGTNVVYPNMPHDPLTKTTLLRWGNYDVATGTARYLASEVPSALSQYSNAVPANQILPASFYRSTKPSWWGTMPWPAIGPDVTGGQDATGKAFKIPAQLCYDSTPKVGGILTFDAANCYGNTASLAAPTSLRIVR
jgi:hypothetical protein